MSLATWDTETTTRSYMKRKASPFMDPSGPRDQFNWVVAHAFKRQALETQTVHYFGRNNPPKGWLRELLAGTKLIGGFNLKFDVLHAITNDSENLEAWMQWVADGGQLWDAQLAEYLLDGMVQESQMLSLDEVAPRYGAEVKIDEVKALWAAGVQTENIEPALLVRYLAGGKDHKGAENMGDVRNTERVVLGQIRRARECGQVNSIMLNMGALLFTIEAERNGMFVDMPLAETLRTEVLAELEQVRKDLAVFIQDGLPFTFNWNSRFHKSALIFGGRVKYDRREYQLKDGTYTFEPPPPGAAQYVYTQKEETHYVLNDGTTAAPMWYEHCCGTEWAGEVPESKQRVEFLSGKNKGTFKTKVVKVDDLTKPKSRMGADEYEFPRQTPPKKEWESEPGVWSTSADVVEELSARNVPFLKLFSRYQSLLKDVSTYYYVEDEDGTRKGMLSLVGWDNLIHHKINQTSTVTARFSSSDPNLQNVPKGSKSKIKLVFRSRFRDGKIIQSDFSSLEVYIQAILTECRQLIDDLRAGLDMHVKRLAAKEHMEYEEVLKLCKGYKLPDGTFVPPVPEWDYKRTGAKVFSFQRAYGAGVIKVAATTGMSVEEVEALVAADDALYPEIPLYYVNLTTKLQASRRPGVTVPHPTAKGVMCNLGTASYRAPDGKLYIYKEEPSPDYLVKRGKPQSLSPTQIKNYIVQGEGAEWAKAACYLAVREFYRRRNFNHLALLVNQVHDAAYVDAAPSVALEAAAVLHACMEAASDYMEWRFNWPIPVPVPSDTTWGDSMADEDRIPDVRELAAPIRTELRARYMSGYTPTYLH